MSKKAKKNSKVEFKDVMVDDKLTIRWDVTVSKIEDLADYLNPSGSRKAHKVTCKIKTGPFKDRDGTFIIFDDDRVVMHSRPSVSSRIWKFLFGKVKRK